MPNLIGGIILGYIWQQMINAVLLKYETTLVANPTYGFWGLIILMNWQMIGYRMIIYVAGLQNVPTDLIEAAQIDGATSLQTLFKVKIPMVMPSITICLFLTVSNSFKLFDQNLGADCRAPSKKTAMSFWIFTILSTAETVTKVSVRQSSTVLHCSGSHCPGTAGTYQT